jgi:hypothetical protein
MRLHSRTMVIVLGGTEEVPLGGINCIFFMKLATALKDRNQDAIVLQVPIHCHCHHSQVT